MADELMGELVDEGTFDEDDIIDVDVLDLDEVTHINGQNDSKCGDEDECVKTLADMNANTSYVVLDPKGELLRDTGNLLESKGYDIKVFDLINMV